MARTKKERKEVWSLEIGQGGRYTSKGELNEAGIEILDGYYTEGSTKYTFIVIALKNELERLFPGATISKPDL